MTRRLRLALATALACALPQLAAAQVAVGASFSRDRVLWHFENPSSYDTAELVPHFFEQRYHLDQGWFTARAAYRAGIDWQTVVAATPPASRPATDYDTFFNPGGVTWVSGTSGNARVHGFVVSQALDLGRAAGIRLTGGYRLRVDHADFLAGDRTDTRNGVLVSRTVVTTREFTTGQQHDIFVAASHEWPITARWTARLEGEASPASINRLAIELPDKYPGRSLVYRTTTAVTSGRFTISGGPADWPLTLELAGSRSWSYSSTQWVRRSTLGAGLSLGRRW